LAFYLERRYAEAKRILGDMLNSSALDGHILLGVVAVAEHDCDQARAHFEWAARTFPAPVTKFGLALAAACSGERDRARQYLAQASEPSGTAFASPYQLALGYAYLGDKDSAIAFLEKSAEAKEGQILYLRYDPLFDGIRSRPALHRVGEEGRAKSVTVHASGARGQGTIAPTSLFPKAIPRDGHALGAILSFEATHT